MLHGILPFTISEVLTLEPPHDSLAPTSSRSPSSSRSRASRTPCSTSPSTGWTATARQAHQVWLPPLDVPDTLDDLMADLVEDPQLGLVSPEWRKLGGLVMPIGTVDRPREQRRDTLSVNLAGAAGHAVVVGGPRSGKSTLLRTFVTSIALTTTPLESQFYVMDFGGGAFSPMAGAAPRGRRRQPVGTGRRTTHRRRGDRHRRPS